VTAVRLKARRVHDTTTFSRHPRQLPRPPPPSPPMATSLSQRHLSLQALTTSPIPIPPAPLTQSLFHQMLTTS